MDTAAVGRGEAAGRVADPRMWRSLLHVGVTLANPGSLLSVSTSLISFCLSLVVLWCVAMIRLHTVHPYVFPVIDETLN